MTDERDGEVTLPMLLEEHGAALLEELAAGLIGRVERYDAATQTCDVQPVIKRGLRCTDGSRRHVQMPILRRVRVEWPRGRRWFLHFPLAVGDFVVLSILDRDHAMWGQTGQISNALDTALHHISHAIARPGVYPDGQALSPESARTDALVLGYDGAALIRIQENGDVVLSADGTGKVRGGSAGADTAVVLETPADAHLDAIAAGLDALQGLASGGPPVQPNYGAAARALLKAAQPIGATKLVAE